MKKRLSALILCIALILSAFAGCATEEIDQGASLADTEAAEPETAVQEVFCAAVLPCF